ncbi:ABC transporter ATP-binding protein [Streptococcus sp. DD13]|uniref:ABC transporter ATP-binding protein n=1 Tax=Streptococcus sp. DD13 TaxID=1777881 RepID=UPI000791823F|nr:ABC transporter ATP-binding protein [Streptococcus sp. DD13]KXT78315.1 ABC-type multidrug transport system, ATPase and permease component [Streptococcus sp. DD13]
MLGVLWKYVKEHRILYGAISLALILYAYLSLIPTQIIQRLVDALAKKQFTPDSLRQDILLLIGTALLNYLVEYFWGYKLFQSSTRFKLLYQQIAFQKMIRMRAPFYEKFRSGDILTRFSTDVEGMMEMVGYGMMILLYGGGMVAFIIPAMFVINWQMSLIAILPLLVLGASIYYIGAYMDLLVEDNREAIVSLNDEVLETVEGIRVIRAYSKKQSQLSQFQQKTHTLAQAGNKIVSLQYLFGPLSFGLVGVSTLSVLLSGAYFLSKGEVTLGQVIALQLYTVNLLGPFWNLSDLVAIYKLGNTAFQKVNGLIQETDDLEEDGSILLDKVDKIVFDNYHFTYPKATKESLQQINLEIQSGQTLGIVGKTGSGKTTLVRQLLRQYPLGTGTFDVNEKGMALYKRRSVEGHIGYVPQEHILFSKTIRENIALGRPDASEEEILHAIHTAAFTEDLKKMPQGLDTRIGERGVSISGGQKQRISLARAFLGDPDLLILDDSLSAVDVRTEAAIIHNMKQERRMKTTLIVSHRLSAVHEADWIIVMDQGRILEEGSAADLLAAQGWYYEQYQRQQQNGEDHDCTQEIVE